jgi:ArsR family transcriptional regulator, arsenate/arsenite/antimonite-responsive transcriptional repressor
VKSSDPDVELLQAIADPVRLSILRQLATSPGSVCACDFTECCTVSQPTVSHHLKVLLQAGLVEREQRGSWAYYRVVPEPLAALREILA